MVGTGRTHSTITGKPRRGQRRSPNKEKVHTWDKWTWGKAGHGDPTGACVRMGSTLSYPAASAPPLPPPAPADLLLVLAPGGVQGLDEGGGVADEHSVARGAHDHAEHGEPDIGHAHRCLLPVANAEHVAHGLEQGVGILAAPRVVLRGRVYCRAGHMPLRASFSSCPPLLSLSFLLPALFYSDLPPRRN